MDSIDEASEFVVAQCKSFADKMPAFYGAIVVCMAAQVLVFWEQAPAPLGVGAPLTIAIVALVRMVWWLERRKLPFTDAAARKNLRQAKTILIVSTAAIIAVDIVLFQYIDAAAKTFVLIELLGCTMTAVYCLMHIRATAYVMAAALLLSCLFTLGAFPFATAVGIAIALFSVVVAMVVVMRGYYSDFLSLLKATRDAQQLSDENLRLANLDMLTDLPNRRQFFVDLERFCAMARRDGRRIAVAIADLDGFKPINDTHGHVVGDRVLRIVAQRIAAARDFRAYRLGGDEFALIALAAEDDSALLDVSHAIIVDVGRPIALDELIVATGCSIGVATFPDMAGTPALLYERADYALFHAKRSGRSRALLFTHEHEKQLRSQGEIEQALRNADIEAEFYLVFQPIVRASDGATLGFECLARWTSPIMGEVAPGAFIPVAEQSGLIANLTPSLLRKALREAATWPSNMRVSFNLSPHDIASRERTLNIVGIIGQSGLDPRRLDLELTETALVHNFEQACENMAILKGIGVNISLDDFGTGYSSLSLVHMLPLDKIKIDRSFVCNMEASGPGRAIVGSIMSLCRDLDLTCIVEGVETAGQLRALSDLGCELAQGYLFSRPIKAADVPAFLVAENAYAA